MTFNLISHPLDFLLMPIATIVAMGRISRFTAFTTAIVALTLAVAACTGSATPSPIKFQSAPVAVVHAGEGTILPIHINDSNATIIESGALPAGMSFRRGPNGAAAITGTPVGDAGGYYHLRLTAADGTRHTTQEMTLSVDQLPYFPTIDDATFGANEYHGNQIVIVATGYPMPQLTYTGTLPGGFKFTQTGTGMITISGSPGTLEGPCSSQITVDATSSSGTAKFPLTVRIGDWRCALNVVAPLLGHLASSVGGVIVGKAGKKIGQWLWAGGKKVAGWVWERGRAVVVAGGEIGAEGAAGEV